MDCKNCGKIFYDDYKFCPDCGQDKRENLTIPLLFRNTFGNYFSVDSKILKSFFPLILRPGKLAKIFIGGQRLKYLHPARFYLFSTIVFFFLFSLMDLSDNGTNFKIGPSDLSKNIESFQPNDSLSIKMFGPNDIRYIFPYKIDSLIKAEAPEHLMLEAFGHREDHSWISKKFTQQFAKLYKTDGAGFDEAFFNTIPIALFFLLPIFALFIKLFHRKKGTFSECLVFSFYFFTFVFIVLTFATIWAIFADLPVFVVVLSMALPILHLIFALRYFFKQKVWTTIIKSFGIVFLYGMLILPISLVILAISTFLFY